MTAGIEAALTCGDGVLAVRFAAPLRALSSAVLGGGLGAVRTWLNVQVPHDYARTDPAAHLTEVADRRRDLRPVVGMLTAADVDGYRHETRGGALVLATVGLGQPTAAAATRPRVVRPSAAPPAPGTINLLVVSAVHLSPAGLVNAVQTATEAKAQALAEARVVAANADTTATGTPTDSVCVACPDAGDGTDFAGPAVAAGADIAAAVRLAVLDAAARPADRSAQRPRGLL